MGLGKADDAAVYQINADMALVQTVDFFPPIVDDPYVYAMGGTPMLALAIAAFPDTLPATVCQRILQGGIDAVTQAGAVVAGGHTITDPEPKYGLCVTGTVHPARIARKSDVRVGDRLLLSKPLGTGIVATAAKRGQVDASAYAAAVASMKQLNRIAAEIAIAHGVRCMTDVTGFGLIGHVMEMERDSAVRMVIEAHRLPLLPTVWELASAGVVPGGLGRNRLYALEAGLLLDDAVPPELFDVAVDPQTSGGLLLALDAEAVPAACAMAAQQGITLTEIGYAEAGRGVAFVA